jgi:hypothetical protein
MKNCTSAIALSALPQSLADQQRLLATTLAIALALGALAQSTPLVLEIELPNDNQLEGGKSLQAFLRNIKDQGWEKVYVWTVDTTRSFASAWKHNLPNPVPERFSYGGAVLRMAILTKIARAEFFVRFDPGCGAPTDMIECLERHIARLDNGVADVVSGQYSHRLALRDDWVTKSSREQLYRVVEAFTNVVPERQIVGGAMFTARASGPLPPAFDDGKYILSDDAFTIALLGNRAVIDETTVVPRSESGFTLKCHAYLCRLCLMAAIRELWRGKSLKNAEDAAKTFYRALAAFAAPTAESGVNIEAADKHIATQMSVVDAGISRYHSVLSHWPDLLETAAELAGQCVLKF